MTGSTTTLLDRARALLKAADSATPGPWATMTHWPRYIVPAGQKEKAVGGSIYPDDDRERYAHPIVTAEFDDYADKAAFAHRPVNKELANATASFIATARNDAPDIARALIEAVEILRALLRRLDIDDGAGFVEEPEMDAARAWLAKHDGEPK